jgi:hypothetical protein
MYPRLIAAEYRAIHVMLALGLLLLVPALILGLPLLNVLALDPSIWPSAPAAIWSDRKSCAPACAKSAPPSCSACSSCSCPTMQDLLMKAPWFVALGLLAMALPAALIELHHSPLAHPDTPTPAAPARRPDHKPPNAILYPDAR